MIHRTTTAIRFATLTFAILAVPSLAVPSLALAQDRGSEKDQEACTPDVFRLCQEFIPNEGPIVACLQAKRAQLSTACAPVIFPPTAAASETTGTVAPRATKKRAASAPAPKKRKHPAKAAR